MSPALARFLAFIMLWSAVAPAFAGAEAAAVHALGCDPHAVEAHADGITHGENHTTQGTIGATDKRPVCSLSALCLPGLIAGDIAATYVAQGLRAQLKPAGDRGHPALLRTLDPPPPRHA